jgi:Integrase core domain
MSLNRFHFRILSALAFDFDFDYRQRHPVYFHPLPGNPSPGGITHRRTAYNHPEGNGRIERFHRSLKEEEVWPHGYQSLAEARDSIASGSIGTTTSGHIKLSTTGRPSPLDRPSINLNR